MAGVTDKPFRNLCHELGAGVTYSEMITSNPDLFKSRKTQLRLDHSGEAGTRVVQIAGSDPEQLANAAKFNVDKGAQIIDINMGCPAKKVCNVMAGSALLRDEKLVGRILTTVVNSVSIPITLKIRTGWDKDSNNAVKIARIAEDSGVQALAVHGRSRACGFKGQAEHNTVRHVKQSVTIPVIANGDIESPEQAREVLESTAADGIMIGRAAQGNPWIFREISHYLKYGNFCPPPSMKEIRQTLCSHLTSLYHLYGENHGVKVARKHLGWYCKNNNLSASLKAMLVRVETAEAQLDLVNNYFVESSYGDLAA
jgi:tRNA-dihydrouridine synthase B